MVHFLPILLSKDPAPRAPIKHPMLKILAIQCPWYSSYDTGRVQLYLTELMKLSSVLQPIIFGKTGELHPNPVPRPKAPIVPKKVWNVLMFRMRICNSNYIELTCKCRNNLWQLLCCTSHLKIILYRGSHKNEHSKSKRNHIVELT